MARLGTCRHCWQIQVMYRVPLHRQPHEPAETRIDQPEEYTCQWLDTAGVLPPPVQRMAGGFLLRPSDCDECPRYEVVSVAIPGAR